MNIWVDECVFCHKEVDLNKPYGKWGTMNSICKEYPSILMYDEYIICGDCRKKIEKYILSQ